MFKNGFSRFRIVVVVYMLFAITFQPVRILFGQDSPCVQAAYDRFNAKQQQLGEQFHSDTAYIVWKYGRDIDSCNAILMLELAAITFWEGGKLAACNLDPEPITRMMCIDIVLFDAGLLVLLATGQRVICGDAAWVDYAAAFFPFYNKLQEDYHANWDRLNHEYYACFNGGNG